jgi:hypothetical protein
MRFLADENFSNTLLAALRTMYPAFDVMRVQDTSVFRADDPTILEWAARDMRILLTHDFRTMPKYAYARVEAGLPMPGVIEVRRDIPFGQAIDELLIILGAGVPSDFENQVRYVPLR